MVAVFNLARMVFLYYKLQLLPFTRKSWLVLVAGSFAWLAGYFWPYLINPFIDAICRTFIVVIVYVVGLIFLKPSEDFTGYLDSIWKNKKLF